jgi:Ca2+:H+ antiporter
MIYTVPSSSTNTCFVIEIMMNTLKREPAFFMAVIAAIYLYVFAPPMEDIKYQLVVAGILFIIILLCIFRVAHFADVLAEMLGEPYGTLLLTVCATLIEVAVMITALTHGDGNPTFVRDTITATLFIVLGGMMGLSMIIGGSYHLDQSINTNGAHMYLGLLIPLALLTLVLPNFTTSTVGPTLAWDQEVFIGVISLALYGVFIFAQTKRYRNFFDDPYPFGASRGASSDAAHPLAMHHEMEKLEWKKVIHSAFWLVLTLIVVILLIEKLAILINIGYARLGFPKTLNGTTVAILVLAPEWLAALYAAKANHLQRSLNIALGSGLATLSLSVPVMLFWVAYNGLHIELGLHPREIVMLLASLWVAHVSISTGKSNIMQGSILFILFISSIFLIFNP